MEDVAKKEDMRGTLFCVLIVKHLGTEMKLFRFYVSESVKFAVLW